MSAVISNQESQTFTSRSSPSSTAPTSRKGSSSSGHSTHDDDLELKEIKSGNNHGGVEPLPLEEDIMQLARLGEMGTIQKLFQSGKYDANYRDEENITPLHVRELRFYFPRVDTIQR